MISSIRLNFNVTVVFGLAVMMTIFSQTFSFNPSGYCEEQITQCTEDVLLTCNITEMTNSSYWYRLSPEKMKTMLEDSSDLSDYEVLKTYGSTETWLKSLSPYDTGLYSSLDRSKPRDEQEICCIRLNVSCYGIENKDETKQHLSEIENGKASPYSFKKTVYFVPRQTDEPVVLRSFTRGYPKAIKSVYAIDNDVYFSENNLQLYDDESHLSLSKDGLLLVPTTYTIRTCNAKGCMDAIFHSVHQTGNDTVVIGEVRGGYVTLCCDAVLDSAWYVQWFIKTRDGQAKYTNKKRTIPEEVPCYFIYNISDKDVGTYQCRKQGLLDTALETFGTFELKISNDKPTKEHMKNEKHQKDHGDFLVSNSCRNVKIASYWVWKDALITNTFTILILIRSLFFTRYVCCRCQ